MDILKFTISGDSAFFKKPETNTSRFLTYGQLHKVALLGILGSIIGLNGYREQDEDSIYPEFYEKLKDIKVSIVPESKSGSAVFNKSFQTFNNSVGYASKDGNLIVREQWLVDVKWDVYIVIEDDITNKIKDFILNKKAIFIPYLGKNEHGADISNGVVYQNIDWEDISNVKSIDSMFLKEDATVDKDYEEKIYDIDDPYWNTKYEYKEYLPFKLDERLFYINKLMIKTNRPVAVNREESKIVKLENRTLYFY